MRHQLHTKFKIGTTALCHCELANMIAEHILQDCLQHAELRKEIWPMSVDLREKLYGGKEFLKKTANFVKKSGISV